MICSSKSDGNTIAAAPASSSARAPSREALKGEAPGVNEGGILEQTIHSVEIEVPLDLVPEKLHVRVNQLQIGGELFIRDIADLPAGATVLVDPDEMVVHCKLPIVQEEEEPAAAEAAGAAEPEVIAKGKEKEEGEEGEAVEEKG